MEKKTIETTRYVSWGDWWDHVKARCSWARMSHHITPGLYTIGAVDPNSPVFVTSNYTLSFDALRKNIPLSLPSAYILVLDTAGINVWCAAGKGTFGTEELCHRIQLHDLQSCVRHHTLIVPQLGATGISAHEVRNKTGFNVEYGPIRASDIDAYFKSSRKATKEMRRVRFPLLDRMVLIPVELVGIFKYTIIGALVLLGLGGFFPALGFIWTTVLNTILFPILLPLLPFKYFTVKGLTLGILTTFGYLGFCSRLGITFGHSALSIGISYFVLILMPLIAAALAVQFTGCTTFSSKSSTMKETLWWLSVCPPVAARARKFYSTVPTLQIDSNKCVGCGICTTVCPHDVITVSNRKATIKNLNDCMECGACKANCPVNAVEVETGVGCAWAIVKSALAGSETVSCDCGDSGSCCGGGYPAATSQSSCCAKPTPNTSSCCSPCCGSKP